MSRRWIGIGAFIMILIIGIVVVSRHPAAPLLPAPIESGDLPAGVRIWRTQAVDEVADRFDVEPRFGQDKGSCGPVLERLRDADDGQCRL